MTRRRPRRPGRPTLLTPETVEQLLAALRLGAPQSLAADYIGVGESTLRRWIAMGRDEQDRVDDGEPADPAVAPHLALVLAVDRARAEAALRALAQIRKAAQDGRWQAAGWLLERQFPEEFGRWRTTQPWVDDQEPQPDQSLVDCRDLAERVTRNIAALKAAWPHDSPRP